MKSIAYIVLYFGKYPRLFPIWLHSCKNNPTIDWIIFTDDKGLYEYPSNVHVHYTTFDAIQKQFMDFFDYPIVLDSPYKLCDYKVCYGAIFQKYIEKYDFWGFCDIDLIWGDIRATLTDDILSTYDKIGFQGHSTLIRNTQYYNYIYEQSIPGETFKEIASTPENRFADEVFYNKLFNYLKIPFYNLVTFANLSSINYNFKITYLPTHDKKNRRFIFVYKKGHLYRVSLVNGRIYTDEFMYVHFLKRDMDICIPVDSNQYMIVPNKLLQYEEPSPSMILEASKPRWLYYIYSHFKENAHKLNRRTVIPIIKAKIRGYFYLFFNNDKKQYEK